MECLSDICESRFSNLIHTMAAGAPENNTNAEKYPLEYCVEIYQKAIKLADKKETVKISIGGKVFTEECYAYDYIGEVSLELGHTPAQLMRDWPIMKAKKEALEPLRDILKAKMERNCYTNAKKGLIKDSISKLNLQANHAWKDRVDHTTDDDKMQGGTVNIIFE